MTLDAKVVFRVNNNKLATFVKQSSGSYASVFQEDHLLIIVKEVKEERRTYDKIRMLAGDIARHVKGKKITKVTVNDQQLLESFHLLQQEEVITAFVEGWYLGSYEFSTYKSKKHTENIELVLKQSALWKGAIQLGEVRAAATAFARDLMNEIPSTLTPETFPTILEEQFSDSKVNVVVHGKKALEKMEMNGLLAVNRGSKYDPAFIELHYKGDPKKPLVALVGKGVTFDTGGISLKAGRNLSDMRMDMGGAAAVAGAIKLLAETKASVNVVGLIQTVENMPDRHSILPGDIITYKTGQTVQVGNTDAEGRLILADGLIRADELEAEFIVDIATLTGAIANALGPKMGGIFGDERLMMKMKEIGKKNGDFVWPMPLIDEYDQTLHSDYADFSNISNQNSAGAITAGLFLRRFITKKDKWIHVDMAGVMESKRGGYYENSATGFGARLLADYTVEISE